MKKVLTCLVACFLTVAAGQAAQESFSGTGSASTANTVIIPPSNGDLECLSLTLDATNTTTCTVYPAKGRVRANANTGATNIVVKSEVSGSAAVAGAVPVAGTDFVIINSSEATNGLQFATITGVITTGVATNDYFTIGLDSTIYAQANDWVYIVVGADTVALPIGASDVPYPFAHRFTGRSKMPVALNIPVGESTISGVVNRGR